MLSSFIVERVQADNIYHDYMNIIIWLYIADRQITDSFRSFPTSLEKGQIQATTTLINFVDVELIAQSIRYKVQAAKSGPNTYFLVMNGSFKEVEIHHLSDGGFFFITRRC